MHFQNAISNEVDNLTKEVGEVQIQKVKSNQSPSIMCVTTLTELINDVLMMY